MLHVRRTREHITARVDPEWRSIWPWLDSDFVRPWMLDAMRPVSQLAKMPVEDGVEARTHAVSTETGTFRILQFEPEVRAVADAQGPALLWIHGGGHIIGGVGQSNGVASFMARETGCPVFSVDYRIGPFPTDFDDCVAALEWLRSQAAVPGIEVDPARIVVGGDSAGGGLAAGLAQWAADNGVPLAFQILEYPQLDDRTVVRPAPAGLGEVTWTPHLNDIAWTRYLGHEPGVDEHRPYVVPARRQDLTGLAPAWIGVGDMDLFLPEDTAYAERLRDAGVPCELHVEPGMYHGADSVVGVGNRLHRILADVLLRAAGIENPPR